ncbi:MAG: NAD(P)H-hydrate dehydratase [Sandaracinus sp.]
MQHAGSRPMRALATSAEARRVDAIAVERGLSTLVLMENAGRGATDVIATRHADALARPLIVGGVGQNGGDAWVVARHLAARGVTPRVALVGPRSAVKGDAAANLATLEAHGVRVLDVARLDGLRALLDGATLVVDGIFGTGLSRPVEGWLAEVITTLDGAGLPVVALDLPSGISADTGQILGAALRARTTITFGVDKRGLHQYPGADHAGDVFVETLGLPSIPTTGVELLERGSLVHLLRARAADAHKGSTGHVLVVAGSPGRTGAALLAGRGAQRMGAGLVTLAARGAARTALDAKVLEAMTVEVPEALEAGVAAVLRECAGKKAAVVGPGLGLDAAAQALARRLALELPVPTVLDADALTALAADPGALRGATAPRVLTPHPGEAARLLGVTPGAIQADRHAAAAELATRTGQVVVLKGAGSLVAEPSGRARVCGVGTPALASGGTGDVLAGACGAMLVTLDPFDAASAAVLAHARAGELAAKADRGLLASEVADALPDAVAERFEHR